METMDLTSALPDETLINIFHHVRTADLFGLGQVCRRWRELSRLPTVWRSRHIHLRVEESSIARSSARAFVAAPCLGGVSFEDPSEQAAGADSSDGISWTLLLDSKVEWPRLVVSARDIGWLPGLLLKRSPSISELTLFSIVRSELVNEFADSIQSMSTLKKLSLRCLYSNDVLTAEETFKFVDRGEAFSTLQELRLFDLQKRSAPTLISLVDAHRYTLREIALQQYVLDRGAVDENLMDCLARCENLSRLTICISKYLGALDSFRQLRVLHLEMHGPSFKDARHILLLPSGLHELALQFFVDYPCRRVLKGLSTLTDRLQSLKSLLLTGIVPSGHTNLQPEATIQLVQKAAPGCRITVIPAPWVAILGVTGTPSSDESEDSDSESDGDEDDFEGDEQFDPGPDDEEDVEGDEPLDPDEEHDEGDEQIDEGN